VAGEMLKGIVIPVDWKKDGAVVAVAISTNKEDEFLVEKEGCGEDLLNHIHAEVEVRGILSIGNDGKRIKITEYKICRTWK